MENFWTTIGTILATGIVIYGGHFLTDYLQGKREKKKQALEREREIKDARRKYRERIVTPIREALVKIGSNLEQSKFMDTVYEAKEVDNSIDTKEMEALQRKIEATSMAETLIETTPLIATITNENTREFLRNVFTESAIISPAVRSKELRSKLHITDEELSDKFNLAYKKMEDYVILAD